MKFVPKRNIGNGPGYLKWYQDGVQVAQKLIPTALGTDFPNNVNLGFVFAILDAAAAQADKSVIKKVRIAQLMKAYP